MSIVCLSAVGLSYVVEGSTYATRMATTMVMPVGLMWLASTFFAIVFGLRRMGSACLAFALISGLVFFTGNAYVVSSFMSSVEWPEDSVPTTLETPFRSVVVLGGGVSISPLGNPELSDDGERVFSAAQLFSAGRTRSIICTGATPDGRYNPSDVGRDLLLSTGIPDKVIYRVEGENTTQEMKAMRQFLDNPPEGFPTDGEVALITSAFHMRRAMRLAEVQGLAFLAYPVAFRSDADHGFEPHRLVPTAGSMADFSLALKERLAAIVGR
ncbi:hypothetical protein Poly51_28020 [Rubripirellula tenax]|uniref:DUF218 domain-containing protein n=2 Tax=Rubripirellula tenax TaxID=2528015 RepID=A0A5C6F8U0_9BACT|nr:hypothetical protein Poly51_28020 [Rubripirellula tenax]